MSLKKLETHFHSVHPSPLSVMGEGGGGVQPPTKLSKKREGLDQTSTLRGGCWKRAG